MAAADDALDAFFEEMNALEEAEDERRRTQEVDGTSAALRKDDDKHDDDDDDDHLLEFLEKREQARAAAPRGASEVVRDGNADSDDEVYATARAVDEAFDAADAAPAFDHSKPQQPRAHEEVEEEELEEIARDVYTPAKALAEADEGEASRRRRALDVSVSGLDAARICPASTFAELGLGVRLLAAVKKAGLERPTPVQSQAIPLALSGRDVLALARTGSGKTLAYLLPMIVHVRAQHAVGRGEGPVGLVVLPSRELGQQVHAEARRFAYRAHEMRCCALLGGMDKHDQFRKLRGGVELVCCTPGRLLDLLKMRACTLRRTSFLVLDEADRMFDMGFEPQIATILAEVRGDRQMLMFSATMQPNVRAMAESAMGVELVRVTVGKVGGANDAVHQVVEVLASDAEKEKWMDEKLHECVDEGEVLVFVSHRSQVEGMASRLAARGHRALGLHGEMPQAERSHAMRQFKDGSCHVLVATDIAARGLDVASIKTVVNFDCAKNIDTHVHRIGRTGRAGAEDGVAITLVTPADSSRLLGSLVHSLISAGQEVPAPLVRLAERDSRFRRRGGRGRGASGNQRGSGQPSAGGLGFQQAQEKLHEQRPASRDRAPGQASRFVSSGTLDSSGGGGLIPPKRQRVGPPPPPPGQVVRATALVAPQQQQQQQQQQQMTQQQRAALALAQQFAARAAGQQR